LHDTGLYLVVQAHTGRPEFDSR